MGTSHPVLFVTTKMFSSQLLLGSVIDAVVWKFCLFLHCFFEGKLSLSGLSFDTFCKWSFLLGINFFYGCLHCTISILILQLRGGVVD